MAGRDDQMRMQMLIEALKRQGMQGGGGQGPMSGEPPVDEQAMQGEQMSGQHDAYAMGRAATPGDSFGQMYEQQGQMLDRQQPGAERALGSRQDALQRYMMMQAMQKFGGQPPPSGDGGDMDLEMIQQRLQQQR